MASETELAITVKAIVDDAIVKLGKVKAGVGDLGNAAQGTTKKLNDHQKSVDGLSGALNKLGTHYRAANQAAELFGVSAGGAVGKMGALINVVEAFKGAIPIFAGVAAAAVSVGAAFNFVRGSVEDAEKLQKAMTLLGQTVRDQGGDWGHLSKQFEEWIELQERTTTFGRLDLIEGVKKLTAAGMDLEKAQKVTRIAEDASAATGKSLMDVENGLMEAMHGRTQALTALGIGTRAGIRDGMSFDTVMRLIEKSMGGAAAAAANTYTGALAQAGNAVTDLKENIGTALLPALTAVVKGFSSIVQSADGELKPALDRFATWVKGNVPGIKEWFSQLWTTIKDLGKAWQQDVNPQIAEFARQCGLTFTALGKLDGEVSNGKTGWQQFRNVIRDLIKDLSQMLGFFNGIGRALDGMTNAQNRFANTMSNFWGSTTGKILSAMIPGLGGVVNRRTGASGGWGTPGASGSWGRHGASGSWGSPGDKPAKPADSYNPADTDTGVDAMVGGRGSHTKKKKAVGATVIHDDSAKVMAAILKAWIGNLTNQMTRNDSAGEKSIAGLEAQKEAVRHGIAMAQAKGTATPAMEQSAAALTAQLDLSIAKIKEEVAARDLSTAKMMDQLENTAASHKKVAESENALGAAHVAVTKAGNALAETIAGLGDHLDTFGQGLEKILASKIPGLTAKQAKPGDPVTLGFSWATFLLSAVQNTKAFADIMKTITEIMGVVAQIFDALRPVIDLFLKGVILIANGFITLWNVIAKLLRLLGIHVALLDKINADFSDLSQNAAPFIQIVHDIPTMNELASGKVGALYPAGTGHDTIVSGITTPITDGLADPGLGGGLLGAILEVVAGIEGLKLLTKMGGLSSVSGGISKLFGSGGMLSKVSAALGSSSTLLGNLFGAGTTLGSSLLAVGGGALVGSVVGNLLGGGSHTTNGAAGGAIGGVMGLLSAAGPIGVIGDILIGAIAAGVFGHKDDPAKMPDVYANGYGQEMADLQGSGVYAGKEAMNANGQSYTESGQVASALGGMGMMQFIASYIAKTGGTGLTSAEISDFTGENVKDTIVGGKDGNLQLANGQTVFWSDLVAAANDAITKIGQSFADMGNAATANISSVAGNITRFIDASTNDLAGPIKDGPGVASGKTTQPVATAPVGGGDINVTIQGDVNGYNDVQQIGSDLADSVARRQRMLQYGLARVPA